MGGTGDRGRARQGRGLAGSFDRIPRSPAFAIAIAGTIDVTAKPRAQAGGSNRCAPEKTRAGSEASRSPGE